MKRGEVDAERQLRQAVKAEAGDAAAARIPHEIDVADETAEGAPALDHVIEPRTPGEGELEVDLEPLPGADLPESPPAPEEAGAPAPPPRPGEVEAPPADDRHRPSPRDFGWLPAEEEETAAPRRPGGHAAETDLPSRPDVEEVPAEDERAGGEQRGAPPGRAKGQGRSGRPGRFGRSGRRSRSGFRRGRGR
jgi:hypothetical protein